MKTFSVLVILVCGLFSTTSRADSCADLKLQGPVQILPLDGTGNLSGYVPWVWEYLHVKVNSVRAEPARRFSIDLNVYRENELAPDYGAKIATLANIVPIQEGRHCTLRFYREGVPAGVYRISARTKRGDLILSEVGSAEPALVISVLENR